MLALIAERVSGLPFHDLVRQRVCEPSGMRDTEFLRSDELPGRAAVGYLVIDGMWRANVFHLPVRGSGDGGIYSTVADVGSDAGVSFCSVHDPHARVTHTVVSNTSDGAWPITEYLDDRLAT